jgi:hypothetical protein
MVDGKEVKAEENIELLGVRFNGGGGHGDLERQAQR